MLAIDGVQVTPTMLATQQGPDRHLGPEAAGAVLILQATFADPDRAAGFWATASALMEQLAVAPGFIRRPAPVCGFLGQAISAEGAAGRRAGFHPPLQLLRRAALHADRTVAHAGRCERVLLVRGTSSSDARAVPQPVAVQPLRRPVGDELAAATSDLLPGV